MRTKKEADERENGCVIFVVVGLLFIGSLWFFFDSISDESMQRGRDSVARMEKEDDLAFTGWQKKTSNYNVTRKEYDAMLFKGIIKRDRY